MLTYGSLFTGIGGFDLGFDRAGMECRWQVENDPFCRRVLDKHWPRVPKYGDVREVDWANVERVDVLCGGFPCQPVSLAGRRAAQSDERWLWPEFAHAVRALHPPLVVVENVPGLLVRGMGDVLKDLAERGYDAEWSVLSACAVGAPHVRRRLFIVAYADGEHGWEGLGNSAARAFAPLQTVNRFESAKIGWQVRLEDPSALYRDADGVPDRMERNRAIGNAVMPDIAEWIGRRLMELPR